MNRGKTDNKGFSLIELIVVIAILGIISVGIVNTFGLLSNASAKGAANKLKTALTETRVECMSKAQASLHIYQNESSEYYVTLTVNDEEKAPVKIGDSKVDITYKRSSKTAMIDQALEIPAEGIEIEFDRDTGEFKPIKGTEFYCKKIIVTSGERRYTLTCERLTGKIILE